MKHYRQSIHQALLLLTLQVLLLSQALFPMDQGKLADHYTIRRWSPDNGMTAEGINSIAQRPDGFLWFGTPDGLYRFDGRTTKKIHFTTEEPRQSWIRLCHTDPSGNLWFVCSSALVKYDGQVFQLFPSSETHFESTKIRTLFSKDSDTLLLGSEGGTLFSVRGRQIRRIPYVGNINESPIVAIFNNKKNETCLASQDKGFFKLTENGLITYDIGIPEKLNHVRSVVRDKKRNLWIATRDSLFYHDGERTITYPKIHAQYQKESSRMSEKLNITTLLLDSEDTLWMGSVHGALRLRLPSSSSLSPVKKTDDLDSAHIPLYVEGLLSQFNITASYRDRENSLWFATATSGLYQLRKSPISAYFDPQRTVNNISGLFSLSNGEVLVSTNYRGLYSFENYRFKELFREHKLKQYQITALEEDPLTQTLWVGTRENGIFVLSLSGQIIRRIVSDPLLWSTDIKILFRDSNSVIWIGTSRGVNLFHGEKLYRSPVAKGERILNFYQEERGDIWIASENGAYRLDRKSGGAAESLLPETPVSSMYKDENGAFWFCTLGKGLIRMMDGQLTQILQRDNLVSDVVYQLFEDEYGIFWISSNRGIYRVSRLALDEFLKGRVPFLKGMAYTTAGLSDRIECIPHGRHSLILSQSKKVLFGSTREICRVNRKTLLDDEMISFPIVIESIQLNSRQMNSLPGKIFENVSTLVIEFTQPSYIYPQKTAFLYRLEGYDPDWRKISPSEECRIIYTNLAPASYTLKLLTDSLTHHTENLSLSIPFVVAPPSSAIWLAVGIALSCILVLFFRHLNRRKRFRNKYQNSSLTKERAIFLLKKMDYLLEVEKVFKDEHLTLSSLAEKMAIPAYQLSQLINEYQKKTFPDLINHCRIEEAKRKLLETDSKDKKILAIAYDVGFKSQAAFYKAFKRYVSMTPKAFQNQKKG